MRYVQTKIRHVTMLLWCLGNVFKHKLPLLGFRR